MLGTLIMVIGLYWIFNGRKVLRDGGMLQNQKHLLPEQDFQRWCRIKGKCDILQGIAWLVLGYSRIFKNGGLMLIAIILILAINIFDIGFRITMRRKKR